MAQTLKNPPAMQEVWVPSCVWKTPRRRKWQPTPLFLPGESHGQRSLVGCQLWGLTESDTTEATAAAAAATLLNQKHVDWTSFPQSAFPGPSDHFISAWGIKVINLVCRIVDFQGTCNPCCYCAFLARPPFQVLQDTADRSTLGSELEL